MVDMMFACEFCGEDVDPRGLGNYRRVLGWTQIRKQGGTNSVTLASDPLGWAHGNCVDVEKMKQKKGWQDTSLF